MSDNTNTKTINDINDVKTPKEIVSELDRFIVGQADAKRATAIALRTRWRRQQIEDDTMRHEITPKNILMIGPTGVGKTEISRRLAALAGAPFIKIEATKFTEVGYVGRDVESIIRDLMERSIKMVREKAMYEVQDFARAAAEDRVLDILLPPSPDSYNDKKPSTENKSNVASTEDENDATFSEEDSKQSETGESIAADAKSEFLSELAIAEKDEKDEKVDSAARKLYRSKLQSGDLDDKVIDVDVSMSTSVEIMGMPGMEDMTSQLQSMMENMSNQRTRKRTMKVKDAIKQLQEDEAQKLLNEDDIRTDAVEAVEQHGIVFLDEIDKIVRRTDQGGGGDVSREGVQRDLLPLIEGCTVNTKYGMIKTDHILFIASGAFHMAKPSDLIPEMQGRLPIRVELQALKVEDFERILKEPQSSLTEQYIALLATEGFDLVFADDGIKRLAEIAFQVNDRSENIGARRLHAIMERLLDTVSFEAPDRKGDSITVDSAYVNEHLEKLIDDEDLSRWIL